MTEMTWMIGMTLINGIIEMIRITGKTLTTRTTGTTAGLLAELG